MSPLIAWIPILAPIGSQNPPLDPSDPQTVILDTSTPNPGPLLTLSPCPSPRFRPPCQPTCSGHCTSQWSPAQTRPWSWGSVTQRPRSQCRQRLDCPRSTSGSSSGGTQVRWGAGRKKSGGPRAWGASPHPLTQHGGPERGETGCAPPLTPASLLHRTRWVPGSQFDGNANLAPVV